MPVSHPINLGEMFLTSAARHAQREALSYKQGHPYQTLSYSQLKEQVLYLAKALKALGLQTADRAIIISENRPEWVIADLAMMCLGITNVGLHEVFSSAQIEAIVREVHPKVIFFSSYQRRTKCVSRLQSLFPSIQFISFEESSGASSVSPIVFFADLISTQQKKGKDFNDIESIINTLPADTLASIIYTSGSAGCFKGVLLTHSNFIHSIEGINGNIPGYPQDRLFSILPLSHSYERSAGCYLPFYVGASICYCADVSTIGEEIKRQQPTGILGVPRFFEKAREKIIKRAEAHCLQKYIFRMALHYIPKGKNDLGEKLFQKFIFSPIRKSLGGKLRFCISGGAKLQEDTYRFFHRIGIVLLEGYGLTEAASVIACNTLDRDKFGTVGIVLYNLDVKIEPSGEIVVKGPSLTRGYLRPSDNDGAFTPDGYFKTGDLGYKDSDGFLVIHGRCKDLLILATGKKIAPLAIEKILEESPYIEQAMVFGEGKKHIGALIVPDYEALRKKIKIHDKESFSKDPRVYDFIATEVWKHTKDLSLIEQVKKFIVVEEPFSTEKGELTVKLSLCRSVILKKYKDKIEKMYIS